VAVERLAHDQPRLGEMCRDYLLAEEASFKPFYDKWPELLESYMKGESVRPPTSNVQR
jgi:hypothetical protein